MYQCWLPSPEDRPTFGQIVTDVEEFLTELMNYFDPNSKSQPPLDPYGHCDLLQDPRDIPEQGTATCGDIDSCRNGDAGNHSDRGDVFLMSNPVLVGDSMDDKDQGSRA